MHVYDTCTTYIKPCCQAVHNFIMLFEDVIFGSDVACNCWRIRTYNHAYIGVLPNNHTQISGYTTGSIADPSVYTYRYIKLGKPPQSMSYATMFFLASNWVDF